MTRTRAITTTEAPIERVVAEAYKVPTDAPESDGTLSWDSTTLILARVTAAGETGVGYGYGNAAIVQLIDTLLARALDGADALATGACWRAMVGALRNQGRAGLSAMAVSAVDAALWDLKGKLLDAPVITLLGAARRSVEAYGSGGFTSYDDDRLRRQVSGWAEDGYRRVKMKIGREPARELHRVGLARAAAGPHVALMVDANGAYSRKQALAFADTLASHGVSWFEEPVSSDDLDGLRLLRDRAPAPIEIAAGEYGYDLPYFERMIVAGSVDVLQADATRAGGITGFMAVDALCQAHGLPLSAHCAPALHAHAACAAKNCIHVEAFHDHLRVERMLFDGAPAPEDGRLAPDLSRPGLGLDVKETDAARFAVSPGNGS